MTKEISCDYACWNSSNDWYTGVYQIITDIHNTSNKLYAITWTSQQHHSASNQRQIVLLCTSLFSLTKRNHHSAVLLICYEGNSLNCQWVFSICFNEEMPYLKGLTEFRINSRHVMRLWCTYGTVYEVYKNSESGILNFAAWWCKVPCISRKCYARGFSEFYFSIRKQLPLNQGNSDVCSITIAASRYYENS